MFFQDSDREIQRQDLGHVAGGTELLLPDSDKWLRLDQNSGTEMIWVVASEDRIEGFDMRVEGLKLDGIGNIKKFL